MNWKETITRSSLATLAGLATHFAAGYWLGYPFLTDVIAEWIMARTPSAWAVPLLEAMGAWAKPFAATGGLATLGLLFWLGEINPSRWQKLLVVLLLFAGLSWALPYEDLLALGLFLAPALLVLLRPGTVKTLSTNTSRREFLTSAAMSSGTVLIAGEAWWRNERLAARAVAQDHLFSYSVAPARQDCAKGLVRKPVTSVKEFYVMSKNTVDPVVDPKTWRLKIKLDDRVLREFSYAELLSLPREERFVTLRCVSNTLRSDLMGTAAWSGLRLEQLVRRS